MNAHTNRLLIGLCLAGLSPGFAGMLAARHSQAGATNYVVRGVLEGVNQDGHQLVIAHEEIPGFMDAMTMPFRVKDPGTLTNAAIGEKITFQLHVTGTESWVDHIEPLGISQPATSLAPARSKGESRPEATAGSNASGRAQNPLREFKFTNELGQPVSLSDFRGQAIALTFFFTRCPIPEFCPRLSRNFGEVQRRLSAMENAPTNWHLLSVTFDPAHDTPAALRAYGQCYQYDPAHWSFLTGPPDKVAELARLCDVQFAPDSGFFSHNFRTLIIDASNHLQMVFPTSGDLSQSIVNELLKAAGGTNRVAGSTADQVRSEYHPSATSGKAAGLR